MTQLQIGQKLILVITEYLRAVRVNSEYFWAVAVTCPKINKVGAHTVGPRFSVKAKCDYNTVCDNKQTVAAF